MVRIARMIGFVVSAIGLQIASGVGFVALLCAVALGWFRMRAFWLALPAVGGAIVAQTLFEGVATSGKVANAMSNLSFLLIVYALISLLGYAIGAVARRWR